MSFYKNIRFKRIAIILVSIFSFSLFVFLINNYYLNSTEIINCQGVEIKKIFNTKTGYELKYKNNSTKLDLYGKVINDSQINVTSGKNISGELIEKNFVKGLNACGATNITFKLFEKPKECKFIIPLQLEGEQYKFQCYDLK